MSTVDRNTTQWQREHRNRVLRTSTRLPDACGTQNTSPCGAPGNDEATQAKASLEDRVARASALFTDYLTQAEMAEAIGVSERTLTRWHNLRVGPPRTVIGRKILYHIPTARAWIAAQEEEIAHRGRGAV